MSRFRPGSGAGEPSSSPAEAALDVVKEVVSPTAPGHSEGSGVILDLPQVTPARSGLSPARLTTVCAAAGLSFAALTIWIARQGPAVPWVDDQVHTWVVAHRTGASTAFARAVTWGGVTTVVLPALIVIGALTAKRGSDIWQRLGTGVLLSGVASLGVYLGLRFNALVGRGRPSVADWAGTAGGPAFPSGHTTAATLFAASCAWALVARAGAGWPRRAIWIGAGAYAVVVGWSRVWLGVHWPTDVVGGWLYALAWFTGTAALILMLRRRSARSRPADA